MFNDNLHNVFKEIYHLVSKTGFDGGYIDKLPPAERTMYVIYYNEEKKQQEQPNNKPDGRNIGSSINTM